MKLYKYYKKNQLLKMAEKEKAEYLEYIKRLQAEFENYKKRVAREQEEFVKYANEKLIRELIDVYENLDRALKNCSDDKNEELAKGLNIVYKQLSDILAKTGLSRIKAEGEQFDHNLHEVLMQTETDEVPEDTVLEELQQGYMLHGKVLRHSMVRIAKYSE